MNLLIAGIGTDIGKTVVSAMVCKALNAQYWKPIQCGGLDNTDADFVKKYAPNTTIIPERYKLLTPCSPHEAANIEGISISLSDFEMPITAQNLVIEMAGGLLVPINESNTMLDIFKDKALEVILVSRHYLGSINHTLLSVELLKQRGFKLKGIVFIGDDLFNSEGIIMQQTGIFNFSHLPDVEIIDQAFIDEYAEYFKMWLTDFSFLDN